MKAQKIEISHRTIIFTVLFLAILWFLYFIRDIILVFFVSLLLMALLNPLSSRLYKFKIPRALSVILIYVLTLGLLTFVAASLVPALIEQTSHLFSALPGFLNNIFIIPMIGESIVNEIASQLASFSGYLLKFTFSAFSAVLGVISVLVMTFYLLLARDKLDNFLDNFFDNKTKEKVGDFFILWEKSLGTWLRGQIILMLSIGIFTFLGLFLLKIPFSLPLAIFAGLLEIVPIIGPLFSAIPAVIVGFGISPLTGVAVAALYFMVQQIENHFLVPKVMEKSTGLNPVITLLCLAIGIKIAGVVGGLMAIPVYLTISLFVKHFINR
jgi:predicted PurR-regulated permease PerM